ncbi:MAG: hypothetical protein AAF466_08025 [Bacteroidota bacterium]
MKSKLKALVLFVSLMLASCVSTFDQFTYQQTLETKVMVENMLKRSSSQQYSDNLTSVNALQDRLQTMLEYEQNKKDNVITEKMWLLHTSKSSALQGFLKLWEEQGTMSEAFIGEFSPEISRLFELMVDFEENKSKESANLINQALLTLTQ